MKLTELKLRNFTVFERADFSFAPGINVFIGENATGKSHLLKVIYALLTLDRARATSPEESVEKRLTAIFRPDDGDARRLVRAGASEPCTLWIKTERGEIRGSLSEDGDIGLTLYRWPEASKALYVPAREVLAMYERFVPLYENRELSFDATYYDICVALQEPSYRGEASAEAVEMARSFQDLLGGEVELRGPRFYVDLGDGFREAALVAEGMRKIATIAHLIGNGSIAAGGVLLWDEPEANLNPRLITRLVAALRALAARGVQVFVATHDFLLAHRLSLAAEYGVEPKIEMRFFSLHHDASPAPVEVESALTVTGIQNNPILDAYAGYYDDERDLYSRELERKQGAAPR